MKKKNKTEQDYSAEEVARAAQKFAEEVARAAQKFAEDNRVETLIDEVMEDPLVQGFIDSLPRLPDHDIDRVQGEVKATLKARTTTMELHAFLVKAGKGATVVPELAELRALPFVEALALLARHDIEISGREWDHEDDDD